MSLIFSSGQIENPDTHLRLTQTRLLLETHNWGLPKDVGEDSHGNIAINQSGTRYMVYNPGQSLVFLPIYFIVQQLTENPSDCYYTSAFIVSFINYIVHAICAYLLFGILLLIGSNVRKAYFIALIFCFTSYSFTFAQSTYEHHYEMLFILLAFYCLLRKDKFNLISCGLLLSAGILFRNTSIFVLPGMLFLAESNKRRLQILVGIIPGILFIFWYNFLRFSNPLVTGYSLAWATANGTMINFWDIRRIPSALYGLLLSPAKGLYIFSPTLFLGFLGVSKFYRMHKRICLSVLFMIIPYLIIYSMNFAWHGSIWSFGPRYILPIIPFLFLPFQYIAIKRWMHIFIIIGGLSQVLLCSVNYKRELLEQFILYNGIDDHTYIYSWGNIPYIVQSKQLMKIVPKNISHELIDTYPNSPWKKEVRTTSNNGVLANSIEKNSINFWWIRIYHLKVSIYFKVFSTLFSIFIILTCLYYAKKSYPE